MWQVKSKKQQSLHQGLLNVDVKKENGARQEGIQVVLDFKPFCTEDQKAKKVTHLWVIHSE